jgi:hypothetical protein
MGLQAPLDPSNRFYNSNLGGGSLYALGCYLIQFATLTTPNILPNRILAQGFVSPYDTKIDIETSFSLQWWNNSNSIPTTISTSNNNNVDNQSTSLSTSSTDETSSTSSTDNLSSDSTSSTDNISESPSSIDVLSTSSIYTDNHNINPSHRLQLSNINNNLRTETNIKKNDINNIHTMSTTSTSNTNNNNHNNHIVNNNIILKKGITATFSTSIQRESLSSIEFLGEFGTVALLGPAHAPCKGK